MTVVLDSGAVTALAGDKARLAALARRGAWPPKVPSVVLTECLTGDHRNDHAANRLLRTCTVVPVEETLAREAARPVRRPAGPGTSVLSTRSSPRSPHVTPTPPSSPGTLPTCSP